MLLWASLSVAGLSTGALIARAKTTRASGSLRATNDPTRGAWGWTSGEQTYLRVRPSKTDPIVARVPHATKVFVWGKYNGWYRVETVDHKFGWIFHDFLNCPKARKIAPLTHAKAIAGSNRASNQTLYGSTATLQNYYGRHRASGAVRGLAKHGVRLAASPAQPVPKAAPTKAAARRARIASARARTVKPAVRLASGASALASAGRARSARIAAAAPSRASQNVGKARNASARASATSQSKSSNLRLASAGTLMTPAGRTSAVNGERVGSSDTQRPASGAHFEVRQSTRGYSVPAAPRDPNDGFSRTGLGESQSTGSVDAIVLDPIAVRPQAPLASSGGSVRAASSRTVQSGRANARPSAPRPVSRSVKAPRPARVFTKAVAKAPAPAVTRLAQASAAAVVAPPAARLGQAPTVPLIVAPPVAAPPVATPRVAVAAVAAPPAITLPMATAPITAPPATTAKPVPVAAATARALAKRQAAAKAWAKRRAVAQARTRARQQRRAWLWKQQQERRNRRLASRSSARDRLRSRMGAAKQAGQSLPPLSAPQTRPITPEELMRARESHLASSANGLQNYSSQNSSTRADAPDPMSDDLYPNFVPSSHYFAPRSDASESIGAYFSLATYTTRSSPRSRQVDDSRWAAPLDGPSAASNYQPRAFNPAVYGPPALAPAVSRSGSPRDRSVGARAASTRPAAVPRKNPIASRGPVAARAGVRGGSPRDYYAAQRRSGGSLFGQTMASQAMAYRGTPYRSGGASPRGFDCSGLVYFLLRQRGFNPPRTAAGLASFGRPVPRQQLEAGDIVLFANTYKRGISHVGIYQGEGKFVHAPHSGARVRTDSINSSYYSAKYWGARRPK